jgi:hypothetical protein
MSPHAYSEGQLVEQPAIGLFATLGWPTVSSLENSRTGTRPGYNCLPIAANSLLV